MWCRDLYETQLGEKRSFAHELGVDTDGILLDQLGRNRFGLFDEPGLGHVLSGEAFSDRKVNMRSYKHR